MQQKRQYRLNLATLFIAVTALITSLTNCHTPTKIILKNNTMWHGPHDSILYPAPRIGDTITTKPVNHIIYKFIIKGVERQK